MKEIDEGLCKLKKKLYVVTNDYPNQGGDSVFIIPELQELAKRFSVTLICTNRQKKCENLLDGVTYLFYEPQLTLINKLKYAVMYFCNTLCWKEIRDILKRCKNGELKLLIGRLYKSIEFFACSEDFFRYFKKNVDGGSQEEVIFYTFWCNQYSLPLIAHRKKYPKYHLITRLHGCDLYEERYLFGRQPFKHIINQEIEKLFFTAERPMQYYRENHPELDKRKTEVLRLGVHCIRPVRECVREESMVLVSCSNVIPLKRVHLIVEALALLDEKIHWIHFGAGESMSAIQKLSEEKLGKKSNIVYSLKGYTPNVQIRQFYLEKQVDCFITTSSTEGGSPVSIMEAMSAGVPIIGTNVGDIPFMINGNGVLLKSDPTVGEIADAIRKISAAPEEERDDMRRMSCELWKEFFDAEKNSVLFANEVEKLLGE